ncbi:MAG: glycosyltransferase, partial [Thermodesulfobacteriota bacterium]
MKIVYVVHDFFPRFYGGTERYVLNLAKQMQRMGHSVMVLTYGLEEAVQSYSDRIEEIFYKTYLFEEIPVLSVRHRLIPADIGCIVEDSMMRHAIKEILAPMGITIMHIAHPMRMPSYMSAQDLGIPVVATLTDFWLLCPRGRFYKPDYSLCNSPEGGKKCMEECGVHESILHRYTQANRFFNHIDRIISPSKFLIDIFRANHWNREIIHISHGVDYHYVKPARRERRNHESISFGYTGVVTRFKGVDLLMKSF